MVTDIEYDRIHQLIKETMLHMVDDVSIIPKIIKIFGRQKERAHFMPLRYRVYCSLLQSFNIQFGNFVEVLLQKLIEQEDHLEVIKGFSSERNVCFVLTDKTNSLIDSYISDRHNNNDNQILIKFESLMHDIVTTQYINEKLISVAYDVDVLFKDKRSDIYYYIEIKYDDGHDTGKFVDINRKFIKTYAGLIRALSITDMSQLKPILYYFTKKRIKDNIYLPEESYIYRGDKLFNEFLTIKYEYLINLLIGVSESQETTEIFDGLYDKILELQ